MASVNFSKRSVMELAGEAVLGLVAIRTWVGSCKKNQSGVRNEQPSQSTVGGGGLVIFDDQRNTDPWSHHQYLGVVVGCGNLSLLCREMLIHLSKAVDDKSG
jgi:hypothetical protein